MKYLYHHRTQGLNVEGVHIRSICNALVDLGNDVRLVSVTSTNDDYIKVPVVKKNLNPNHKPGILKSIARHMPEPIFEILELAYNLYAFFRLWKVIHQYRPDYIYERYSLFLFSTLILSKMYGIPVVYEINDSAQLVRVRTLFFTRLASLVERKTFKHCNGLVFVSQRLREMILGAYPEVKTQSIISPNASDKNVFFYDENKKLLAKTALSLQHQNVCGFIGCFALWHGVHHFMEKIAPILKLHPTLTLLLIGDGETLPEIEIIIKKYNINKQVVLTGNVPHGEIINYVRAMDFSVLPSTNEYGSPMKMFELMGAGVPLVAANFPPVVEILEDNKDGWVFPQGDFDACIDLLIDIHTNPEKIKKAAALAEQKIHKHHQWRHNANHLHILFASAMKIN
ncbi:MAG: glycosyltransferase involved in cell wall biosynthesis [Crocinitomicaceae bacterium]|jgi:glycosyltransferase involved in cell wall biosynthesis